MASSFFLRLRASRDPPRTKENAAQSRRMLKKAVQQGRSKTKDDPSKLARVRCSQDDPDEFPTARVLPSPTTEGLGLPSSTARIEGPLFHRGASASKEEGAAGPQSAIWPS